VILESFHASRTSVILVSVPLMILASGLTHLTARHSVARQNPESATAQTAIMNKITVYLFPLGVLVFGLFFPIGLLLYWLANNSWTLMQQRIVYRKIDAEEEEKKTAAIEKRSALGPKPGQKPTQTRRRPAITPTGSDSEATTPEQAEEPKAAGNGAPRPGQKPTQARKRPPVKPATPRADTAKPAEESSATGNGSPATKKPTAGKRPLRNSAPADGSTEVPGLISDRSRSKKSGRKNR
jgi:YidC/Oxa1 family membrane protein insertase